MAKLKGISLFASAGIGEMYLKDSGIDIVAANELIPKRAECYTHLHPDTLMIQGNITETSIKNQIRNQMSDDVKFLLATPPCQGLSTLGKNKSQKHFETDPRNFLIFDVLEIIDSGNFDYILIENVPRFLKMYFPYKNGFCTLEEILTDKYESQYVIEVDVLNAKDYGVPQTRPRAIVKLYKKGCTWTNPKKEKEITMEAAIGHLPSLEAGEESDIPWHVAKAHNERAILALKNTPTGQSALINEVHYPKKENGERIKGFHNTFKRMRWDQPCPARTTYSGSISSHNNVHPGYQLQDNTYSDARVLTILETLIVSSMPEQPNFPAWATDTFIRTIIGESIPPLMLKKIVEGIMEEEK